MQQLKKLLILGFLLGALQGCATWDYKIPDASPKATMTLANTSGPGLINIVIYEKQDCTGGPKVIDKVWLGPSRSKTFEIEAGKTFSFAVQTLRRLGDGSHINLSYGAVNTCIAAGSFTPLPGSQYRAEFFDKKPICLVELRDLTLNKLEAGFIQKAWVFPTMFEGARCQDFSK